MRTKFNFTVIPANAKSSKDALAALRLLKGLYEGTATIKGEKKSFPKQDISDIDMEDLTNKIALWTDICTLEEKLNVSFDPGAPMPQEDLEFLYQLRACHLCHKKIAWKHPFQNCILPKPVKTFMKSKVLLERTIFHLILMRDRYHALYLARASNYIAKQNCGIFLLQALIGPMTINLLQICI